MGSENSADQAWDLVASWSWEAAMRVGHGAIIRGLRQPERPGAARCKKREFYRPTPPLHEPARVAPWAAPWCSTPARSGWCCAPCSSSRWCCVCVAVRHHRPRRLAGAPGAADRSGPAGHAFWLVTACSLKECPAAPAAAAAIRGRRAAGHAGGLYACACCCWLARRARPALAGLRGRRRPCRRPAGHGGAAVCARAARTPAATAARLTELQSRIRPHFLFNAP